MSLRQLLEKYDYEIMVAKNLVGSVLLTGAVALTGITVTHALTEPTCQRVGYDTDGMERRQYVVKPNVFHGGTVTQARITPNGLEFSSRDLVVQRAVEEADRVCDQYRR